MVVNLNPNKKITDKEISTMAKSKAQRQPLRRRRSNGSGRENGLVTPFLTGKYIGLLMLE